MPSATTKEWEGFGSENKIMSIDHTESGFESEIVIQAAPRLFKRDYRDNPTIKQRDYTDNQRPARPKTASKNKNQKSRDSKGMTSRDSKDISHVDAHSSLIEQFPSSRGLVKK